VVTPTAATQSVNASQALSAASLFATSDADGDAMTQYEFLDVGVGGGRFRVNGTPMGEGDGSNWTVSAAQLAQTTYTGGAGAGSETIWVRASDGTAWSAWKSWTMQTQAGGSSGAGAGAGTNQAPVVTAAAAIQTVAANTAVGASTLFGATDADGNGTITAYEFLDVGVGGGRFRVNGTAMGEGDGKNFIVSAAQLMQTTYTGGLNAGTETLWVRASDGTAWSAWKSWQMGTLAG
jgi:azurin